jgi:hypothetical protein
MAQPAVRLSLRRARATTELPSYLRIEERELDGAS